MKIHFYSIQDGESIDFISDASFFNNTYIFQDKTADNITAKCKLCSDNKIEFVREGFVSTFIVFELGKRTKAKYKDEMGLAFDFMVYTKRLEITEKKISIEYDYYI